MHFCVTACGFHISLTFQNLWSCFVWMTSLALILLSYPVLRSLFVKVWRRSFQVSYFFFILNKVFWQSDQEPKLSIWYNCCSTYFCTGCFVLQDRKKNTLPRIFTTLWAVQLHATTDTMEVWVIHPVMRPFLGRCLSLPGSTQYLHLRFVWKPPYQNTLKSEWAKSQKRRRIRAFA